MSRDAKRNGRPPLGYTFTPTPRSLLVDFRDRKIDHDTYVLMATLYDRADPNALIAGQTCIRETLKTIQRWSRWPGEDLARQIQRLRDAGYLKYSAGRGPGATWAIRLPKPMSSSKSSSLDAQERAQSELSGQADD